jgi:DNA-binding NarL/FixJ family response regulator
VPVPESREGDAAPPRSSEDVDVRARPVTDRQLEILRNVAQGRTNREIGEVLGISELTVRNHMRAILKRLSSSDRTHAVVVAIGNGWIPIPIEPDGASARIDLPATVAEPS